MSQFFQIPASIMYFKEINNDDKVVFSLINGYLLKNETCFYTNKNLAIAANISLRTAERITSKLVKLKLLNTIGHTFRRKFMYGEKFIQLEQKLKSSATGGGIVQKLNLSATSGGNSRHQWREVPSQMAVTPVTDGGYIKEQNKKEIKEQHTAPPELAPEIIQPSRPETVVVVFSKIVDQDLINFVSTLPFDLKPTFHASNQELLLAFKFHIEIQMEKNKISFEMAKNGLKKLMKSYQFQIPKGFQSEENFQKQEEAKVESEKWLLNMAEESRRKGNAELKPVTDEQVAQVKALGLGSIFKTMLQ